MADAGSLPSTPVERSSNPPSMADDSSFQSTPVRQSSNSPSMTYASSLPSTPAERSSTPTSMTDASSLPSTPVEQHSSSPFMEDDSSFPSTPVEQSSNPPPLPDWMQQRYEEYISRKAQESDYTRLQTVLEDLEREEDTLYIIGLIQMYKDADTYFEDDIQEDGEFAVDLSTLPEGLKTKIWNYLYRRGLLD
ncbi:hypothetical protein GGI42DRAFT_356673 [Trichoderma sp. SZMC 28013]